MGTLGYILFFVRSMLQNTPRYGTVVNHFFLVIL
jgi:hypothetical protein